MKQRKIIHVEIDGKNFYFGSISAIYDTLSKEQLGICKEALWNTLKGGVYQNKKVTIRQSILLTRKSNRGFNKKKS